MLSARASDDNAAHVGGQCHEVPFAVNTSSHVVVVLTTTVDPGCSGSRVERGAPSQGGPHGV